MPIYSMHVHAEIHLYSIHYVHQAGPPNMHGHTAEVSDCSNKPDYHLHRNASHSVNKLLNSLENSLSLSLTNALTLTTTLHYFTF